MLGKIGNAGMPQESFRRPFPTMPYLGQPMIDDSMNQMDYQMRTDINVARKGTLKTKY